MIRSFRIRNFRAFDSVEVSDLKRINVVVGENGSGKTALLEALFLASGLSPELVIRTRSWRGTEDGRMAGSNEELHAELWGDIFHKFQTKSSATVSLRGQGEQTRQVVVKFNEVGQARVVPPQRSKPGAPVTIMRDLPPIEFKWTVQGRSDFTSTPDFADGRLNFTPVPDSYIRASFFASNRMPPAHEVVGRFSALSKSFHEQRFVEKFSQLYPHISGLSIETGFGVAALFATVDGMPQKIPLSIASGGMLKLAGILLAFSKMSGGVIFIDEIENGFYYEKMPEVWRAILDFALEYDCQVFLSTHSRECLKAAADIADTFPEEFCMLRTVWGRDGTTIRRFDGARFASAVLANVEVR